MALLPILTYPDERLKKVSKPVEKITKDDHTLIANMFETMFANKGVGLAAPQVGVHRQIIVVAPKGNKQETYVYINPIIMQASGEVTDTEGCLSVPCASAEVTRAKKIWVEALNENGEKLSFVAEDFLARIIQHETDHLKGTLFMDHLGFSARKEVIDCTLKVNKL